MYTYKIYEGGDKDEEINNTTWTITKNAYDKQDKWAKHHVKKFAFKIRHTICILFPIFICCCFLRTRKIGAR